MSPISKMSVQAGQVPRHAGNMLKTARQRAAARSWTSAESVANGKDAARSCSRGGYHPRPVQALRKRRKRQPCRRGAACRVKQNHPKTAGPAQGATVAQSAAAQSGVFYVVFPAFCPFQLRIHPRFKLGKDGLQTVITQRKDRPQKRAVHDLKEPSITLFQRVRVSAVSADLRSRRGCPGCFRQVHGHGPAVSDLRDPSLSRRFL